MQGALCLLLCPSDGLFVHLEGWEAVDRQEVHIGLLLRQNLLYLELHDQGFGLGLLVLGEPVDGLVGEELCGLNLHKRFIVGKLGLAWAQESVATGDENLELMPVELLGAGQSVIYSPRQDSHHLIGDLLIQVV